MVELSFCLQMELYIKGSKKIIKDMGLVDKLLTTVPIIKATGKTTLAVAKASFFNPTVAYTKVNGKMTIVMEKENIFQETKCKYMKVIILMAFQMDKESIERSISINILEILKIC